MKVALVYDRVNKWGGAERVLLALHKIWPAAPLYTAVYDKKKATWADVFDVHPTFLQNVPHEFLPWITPLAFETFNFDAYDVVISVTSAEAKNIITKPSTVHICYCLTPTRYLWSGKDEYERSGVAGGVLRVLAPMLRNWDMVASSRPDYYIAISDTVKKRIKEYYQKEAELIYPPVSFRGSRVKPGMTTRDYFLVVSRLVSYKRVDLVVDAFNKLGWALVIIGEGNEKRRLMKMANRNVRFLGEVGESELVSHYAHCRAFIHAGIEDFGIAAVEAQAAGIPVVAYGAGGMREIVIPGETGELFERQTPAALIAALEKVNKRWYDSALCRKNASRFSESIFLRNMKQTVVELYNKHTL